MWPTVSSAQEDSTPTIEAVDGEQRVCLTVEDYERFERAILIAEKVEAYRRAVAKAEQGERLERDARMKAVGGQQAQARQIEKLRGVADARLEEIARLKVARWYLGIGGLVTGAAAVLLLWRVVGG